MASSEEKTIDRFVENVLTTRFDDIDSATIEQAKMRIIDTVGCLIAGSIDPGNAELVELMKNRGGKPEATVLIYGGKIPVGFAAMVNCILCRSFDYEPVSPVVDGQLTPAHITGTNVMTALGLAEAYKISGREMLTAMLVGDDMTARILATSGFSINNGWDGNGTGNAFGVAAIAGRIMGLDQNQLKHAFGLAVSRMGGTMQNIWDGSPAFRLPQGYAAENGIFSAQLAAAGWTGADDGLQGRFGYYSLYTGGITGEEKLTKDLGRIYYADRAIKPYPACRATHPPISGAIALAERHDIKADEVQEVTVYMPQMSLDGFCGKPLIPGSFPHADSAFSYQYTIATALMHRSVKPDHFRSEVIRDSGTLAFVNRIKLAPISPTDLPGIIFEVRFKDGRQIREKWIDDNKGDFIENPLTTEEFQDKFMGNVSYSKVISEEKARSAFSLVQNLENLDAVDELVGLLTG